MTTVCCLLAAGVFVGLAYIYREVVVKGKSCTSKVKLHGKTVIVTGKYGSVVMHRVCARVCVCVACSCKLILWWIDLTRVKNERIKIRLKKMTQKH